MHFIVPVVDQKGNNQENRSCSRNNNEKQGQKKSHKTHGFLRERTNPCNKNFGSIVKFLKYFVKKRRFLPKIKGDINENLPEFAVIKKRWLILLGSFGIFGFVFSLTLDKAHYNLAKKLFDEKKYSRSAEEFRQFTEKYPYSVNLHSGYYLAAKSYYLAGDYTNALLYYQKLALKPGNPAEKKQALFGESETRFKMADYREAAASFQTFAVTYPESPAAHAALYYAARSREVLEEWPEAELLYRTLTEDYPESPYLPDAGIRLANCNARMEEQLLTSQSSVAFSSASSLAATNLAESASSAPLTNIVWISNEFVGTQQNNCETNDGASSLENETRKKEEELERYRALLELKAKLLKIKERVVRDKNDLILSDTLTNG